jgi:hypothetical protein
MGGNVNVHYHYQTRLKDLVTMGVPPDKKDERFGHRIGFVPDTTKPVKIGWMMFKDPMLPLAEMDNAAKHFDMRPMVLPEGLALCHPDHENVLGIVLEWFRHQAHQSGMISSSSAVARRQFRLPIMASSVFLGGKFRHSMVPCLDVFGSSLSRVSLMPTGGEYCVGQHLFPCVVNF